MANNEEVISETEIEVEDSDIDEREKVSEAVLVLEVFRAALRAIILSVIIFLLVSLDKIVTGEISTVIVSFFAVMIPIALLFMVSGTAVVGLLAFLNNRIDLSYEKKQGLDKIISHIDLIVSSVLVSVSLFMLPNVFDWGSRITIEALLDVVVPGPGYGIYGLQVIFAFFSTYIIYSLVVIISFVFLYGAIFYRFATRIVRFLDTENKFTLTYIDRSGKSYLYAIGLMMGYTFLVVDSISSELPIVYLMLFALPFALGQRSLAKTTLDKNGKDKNESMATPVDRLTKWYSFTTKRAYRWLILIGIFISLTKVLSFLLNLSLNIMVPWQFIGFSSIAAVAFSTLYFIVRYFAVTHSKQESAIGKRIRLESAADLVGSSIVTVIALLLFITEIGPAKWIEMVMILQARTDIFMYPPLLLQIQILATLWQLWMILLLLAMILRLYAVGRAFTDRYREKELRTSKLLSRSGKILIIALTSLISAQWTFSGILFFGFITDVQVFVLLTLIILQTVVSQVRMREIKLEEEVVK